MLLSYGFSVSADSNGQYNEVNSAVINQCKSFLERIPIGKESFYGFESREDIKSAKTCNPIPTYTIFTNQIENENIEEILAPMQQWKVQVICNDQPVGLLTVEFFKQKYSVVDFGAKELAIEISNIIDHYNNKVEGDFTLLRLYDFGADFIMIKSSENIGNWKVIPLKSAAIAFNEHINAIEEDPTLMNLISMLKKYYPIKMGR